MGAKGTNAGSVSRSLDQHASCPPEPQVSGPCLGQFSGPDVGLLIAAQEIQEESFALRSANEMLKPPPAGARGVVCCRMSAFCSK